MENKAEFLKKLQELVVLAGEQGNRIQIEEVKAHFSKENLILCVRESPLCHSCATAALPFDLEWITDCFWQSEIIHNDCSQARNFRPRHVVYLQSLHEN